MELAGTLIADIVRRTLDEDLGEGGDVTARLCVPQDKLARARITAKERGVVAGLALARQCFLTLDDGAQVDLLAEDGAVVDPGDVVLSAHCRAAVISAAERSALNLMQRLSGIATQTRAFVDAVAGTGARVFDTRKTTPGLRALEKYAVRLGGGTNHRFGLFDQVMIKENHLDMAAPTPVEQVVRRVVEATDLPVVVEARDLDEALAAVRGRANVVLLDNFAPGPVLRDAVAAVRREAADRGVDIEIEASGGIRLDNVRDFAECGVDRVSVGALTHSVKAMDFSMLVEEAA